MDNWSWPTENGSCAQFNTYGQEVELDLRGGALNRTHQIETRAELKFALRV